MKWWKRRDREATVAVEGNCAYIYLFGENEAHAVARTVTADAIIDINAEGRVIGVEIIGWPT